MKISSGGRTTEIIEKTSSLCPQCLKTLPSEVHVKENRVYLHRVCTEHGEFDAYIWPDAASYRWINSFSFPEQPRKPQTGVVEGCPRDCGLCPDHRRHSNIAEIEVTWRCNLKCPVCFMASGKVAPDPELETIIRQFEFIKEFDGVNTPVQLTGGEPTVRADLPEIIAHGAKAGFRAIELNTNGIVIAENRDYLRSLKKAGLSEVYLQFDGLTPEVTRSLRGADLLSHKLEAIENCRREGVPIALAVTVVNGINEGQLGSLINFAFRNTDVICGVSFQPAFQSGRFDVTREEYLSTGDIAKLIEVQTDGRIAARDFWPISGAHPLCDTATYLIGNAEKYEPLTRRITQDDYREYFSQASPQGSTFTDLAARINNGVVPQGLPVLIMGLMDAWIMDLNKLQQCDLTVMTPEGRSIPFCAYHLTYGDGRRLYPVGEKKVSSVGNS